MASTLVISLLESGRLDECDQVFGEVRELATGALGDVNLCRVPGEGVAAATSRKEPSGPPATAKYWLVYVPPRRATSIGAWFTAVAGPTT